MSIIGNLLDRLQEVSDFTIFNEIRHYETWEQWIHDMDEPKPSKKTVIEDWIRDRWESLEDDVSREAEQVYGKLIIHRCISVKDPESFVERLSKGKKIPKYPGLGVFWTYSFGAAECHWGHDSNDLSIPSRSTKIILTGLVDLYAIDMKRTVFANFNPDIGAEEKEIQLKDDAPVLLTAVSIPKADLRWQFGAGIPLKA